MEKETKNPIEIMKQNPSFAPLAKLAEIDAAVKVAAAEASVTASKLAMLECHKNGNELPAIEPLFELYSFYAEKARSFSTALLEALKESGIDELQTRMERFSESMTQKLAEMYANDPQFKEQLDSAAAQHKA